MAASNFENATLANGPSPKIAQAWVVTDGFAPSNASGNNEAMPLSYFQDKGGITYELEDQKLADEGSQNFLWKVGVNYPILLNDNVTWWNCLLQATANRSQLFVKNDDGDALNFVRNLSNDFTTAPNGSALLTWNGMKRTISMSERKIELIGQTGMWNAEYMWQHASAQTAGYITAAGNISGGTPLGLSSISGLTPLLPGFWKVTVGGAFGIGELSECTLTETVMGNPLQFNQFECRDLEVTLTGKGIQTDGVQRLAAGYNAFNNGAVIAYSINGETFTFTSGSMTGGYKVLTHGNAYPEIEFTFKRKFKLNAAQSHVNYVTPLAPVFTY